MTLHKAIEAAREALLTVATKKPTIHGTPSICREALSTLPAKPMSEDEIMNILRKEFDITAHDDSDETFIRCIRALRDAGVLYVEEK